MLKKIVSTLDISKVKTLIISELSKKHILMKKYAICDCNGQIKLFIIILYTIQTFNNVPKVKNKEFSYSSVLASYPKDRGIDSYHRQFFLFFKNYLKKISRISMWISHSKSTWKSI